MRQGVRSIGLMGLLAVAVLGWGAEVPLAPMQVVFVPSGTPTPFLLGEGDPDLLYAILQPPANGALVGIPPNLTYLPEPGFIGTDWVHYLVQAETGGWDLGTVQLVVLAPGTSAGPFALISEGELVWSGPTFAWDGYRFLTEVRARFTYLEQSFRATWTDTAFTSLVSETSTALEGSWPTPWRLPITSTLDFDPTVSALRSWTVDARTTVLGATWISTFYYSGAAPQTASYVALQVQGELGPLAFDSRTTFVTLTPTFGEQRLTLRGPWLCEGCPTNWELGFVQSKAGFESLSIFVKDIEIPCPGCGSIRTFFDVKVTFTVDEKKLEPALRVSSGFVACAKPLVGLVVPETGFGLAGFDVYGIEIKCDVAPGYTLRLLTSFNSAKDSLVTGYPQFFELWQLEGPVVPCCGNPGRFQISLYFMRGEGSLFGFGMGNILLYFPVSREVLVSVGLKVGEVDPGDPSKTWILTTGWKALF
ncbi:MAG: hypothetical protein Kow0097_08930 [Candidatus Bipolaricaulota bacterium]